MRSQEQVIGSNLLNERNFDEIYYHTKAPNVQAVQSGKEINSNIDIDTCPRSVIGSNAEHYFAVYNNYSSS